MIALSQKRPGVEGSTHAEIFKQLPTVDCGNETKLNKTKDLDLG